MNLDTFSPVNQNGSFEFDRVLKCGYVEKRTRKTKVTHLGGKAGIILNTLLIMKPLGLEIHIPSPSS